MSRRPEREPTAEPPSATEPPPEAAPRDEAPGEEAPGASWEQQLEAELAGIESSNQLPPEGLQPRRVILTSQNGSSLTFVRRRRG